MPSDALTRRLSDYERLALTWESNLAKVETQAAKIRLCVDTAREVWGGV